MLSEIVKYNNKNDNGLNLEYENNIIAFCGERGEGKSSVMLSFAKAIKKSKKVFEDYNEIEDIHFSEPVVIDPSLFDETHGILDVILAKIYNKFDSIYIVSDFCLCVCIHFLLPKILVFDIQDSI